MFAVDTSGINGITYVSVNDIVPRIHACSRYFIAPLLNVCRTFRSILSLSSCGMKRLSILFTASASCGPWSASGCAEPLCQKRPRSADNLADGKRANKRHRRFKYCHSSKSNCHEASRKGLPNDVVSANSLLTFRRLFCGRPM